MELFMVKEVEEIVYEPGFPKWQYHKADRPEGKIFYKQADIKGSGWVNSPAQFSDKEINCPVVEVAGAHEIKEEKKPKKAKK